MNEHDKSKQALNAELERLRQRVAVLETSDAQRPCAEEDLRRSEAKWRSVVGNAPLFVAIVDRSGRIEFHNRFQPGLTPENVVGRTIYDFLQPECHDIARKCLERVFDTGETTSYESVGTGPNGTPSCYETHVGPVRLEGEIVAATLISSDITARKRAEEAVKKAYDELEQGVKQRTDELSAANEQLRIFRMFADASGQGFGMADLDGYITYWNPTLCRFFGDDKPEDAVGKHVTSYYPKDYFEKRQNEILPAVMRDGYWQGELLVDSRQGKATPILQNTFLVRDDKGNPVRLAVAITDITERKQAEEALRESHDELRAIYDSMGDGLLISDRETLRLVRANAPICSMLGYSEEELLSLSIPDLHPQEALAAIVETLQAGAVQHFPVQVNMPMIRKDGSIVYVDITGDTLTYHGRPCSLGVFRDVTERRRAQSALEKERQTLWHMLQASDHERQLIAYEIHDGLAQLLTGAMMQYQAYEHLDQDQPEKAKMAFAMGGEMLQMAYAEARRLISGVRPPVLDEAGVETAIAHLVHDRRGQRGPKIEYKSDVQFSRLPKILENALYRIAQEALANACKHSQSKKVRVRLAQEGQIIRLEVRDWGIGFDPQSIEEGHFGLEGIRERVRLLGGQIVVDSGPGRGALIRVEVPLLEREQPNDESWGTRI